MAIDHTARRTKLRARRDARKEEKRVERNKRAATKAMIQARYDLAQTSPNNRNHWAWADGLTPQQSNLKGVRAIMRNRSRYERANNSYIDGMVTTYANSLISTGPVLEMTTETGSSESRRTIEKRFTEWMKAAGIVDKLITSRMGRMVDGEGFGILIDNPAVAKRSKFLREAELVDGPGLDVILMEADQCTDPTPTFDSENEVDGIKFDDKRNPLSYEFLKTPISGNTVGTDKTNTIKAEFVIHDFKVTRAGQLRGVVELLASLPLAALMRGFTLAVCDTATAAANFVAVLQSDTPADDSEGPEGFEEIELVRNMATVVPSGYKLGQMDAKQPTDTYREFKRELVAEMARPILMPYNIAAGDSSDYNFASGRLDHQTFDQGIDVDRAHTERVWMERLFSSWWSEAILIEGYLPQEFRSTRADNSHVWQWKKRGNIDDLKQANANRVDLDSNATNLRTIYADQNKDWEVEVAQRMREIKAVTEGMKAAGLDPTAEDVNAQMHSLIMQLAHKDDD